MIDASKEWVGRNTGTKIEILVQKNGYVYFTKTINIPLCLEEKIFLEEYKINQLTFADLKVGTRFTSFVGNRPFTKVQDLQTKKCYGMAETCQFWHWPDDNPVKIL